MKVEVTEVAPCRKKIAVEIPADKVDAAFDEAYKELGNGVQLKGFRRGHAPRKLLERKFAKDVAKDVRAKLFQESFMQSIKDKEISPMGEPSLDAEKLEATPGQPFTYETEVDVRPKFDLPEYKGLSLAETLAPVSDADIDQEIENLRKSFAEHEESKDPSAKGDILEVEAKVVAGEETLLDEKTQRVRVEGDRLFGIPFADVEKELAGLKPGDEKTFSPKLPDDFHKEALRGAVAKTSIKVLKVLRPRLPELDQRFAQRVGFDDMEALKKRIRENLEGQRQSATRQALEKQAIDQLVAASKFDLPAAFLRRQTENNLVGARLRLARMGATKEYLEEKAAEIEKSSAEQTERSLRWSVISDAIADKEEVKIEPNEVQMHIEALAKAYNTTPAKMFKRIQDMNGLAATAAEIRDIKVMRIILDEAEVSVDEGNGEPVKRKRGRPRMTDEEKAAAKAAREAEKAEAEKDTTK